MTKPKNITIDSDAHNILVWTKLLCSVRGISPNHSNAIRELKKDLKYSREEKLKVEDLYKKKFNVKAKIESVEIKKIKDIKDEDIKDSKDKLMF